MAPESNPREVEICPGLDVAFAESGAGSGALVLHGGAGPETVTPISQHLAASRRVLTPTHPGFNGRARPQGVDSVADLAAAYLQLLALEGMSDVVVVGNSVGGWIALEMAVGDQAGLIAGLVLIDSVGVDVPGEPITDFFSLTPRQAADATFDDGDRFYRDPAGMEPAQARVLQANLATLRAIAGDPYMHEPRLAERLARVTVPAVAIWGESDRIVTPAYGRALAQLLPACGFQLIAHAGHLPQLEQPEALFGAVDTFTRTVDHG